MGGRSATSGVATFGRKTGTRLSPKQYKSAVSDEANFIFRELQQQPALQHIIRKSFKGNTTEITFEVEGSHFEQKSSFIEELNKATDFLQSRESKELANKKKVNTWSAYDVSRAKAQALKQAMDELEKLRKKTK